MKTWIYPVNGDTKRNVKMTMLPSWTLSILGNKIMFIPAFRRLWISTHLSPLVSCADDLARFDALIACSHDHLQQQAAYPVGGIGWWIERWASLNTRLEQDLQAYAAYIRSFHYKARAAVAIGLATIALRYAPVVDPAKFPFMVLDLANSPLETGGI